MPADPRVHITRNSFDIVEEVSTVLGVTKTIAACALIEAAAGNYHTHVEAYLKRNKLSTVSRGIPRLDWTPADDSEYPGLYRCGDWSLIRIGDANKRSEEGNGWYLEGPGLHDARYMGRNRGVITRLANEIIIDWQQSQQQP